MAITPDDNNVELPQGDQPDEQGRFGSIFSQRGPMIIAIGATIASLVLICLFAFLLLRSDDTEEPTPTPAAETDETVDTDTFPFQAISDSGAISVTMETPIFLDVAGTQFSVQAETLGESGSWTPPNVNETTAAWVFGSVINYIFGLDDTDENRSLLEQLNEGEQVTLTTRSGAQSAFAVSSRQEVAGDDREIFAQRAPGITLVMIQEDPEDFRLVVQGRYILSDTKQDAQGGQVVEMGETAQLENLQITVTGASTQYNRPEAPSGFGIFLIDYQAQNVGTAPFDTSRLSMVLADDFGNLYALNPTASQLGNYPPLSGSVSPGQTILASVGFQIPSGLSSAFLHWRVSIAGTNSAIQIDIPFQDSAAAEQLALVEVQEVTISPDGASLLIVGQIINGSDQPLIVDVSDVSLRASTGTIFQMLSTNPAFPWTVPPGQTILYGVTFQRPLGSDAVFTVLNQSFQLTGLR